MIFSRNDYFLAGLVLQGLPAFKAYHREGCSIVTRNLLKRYIRPVARTAGPAFASKPAVTLSLESIEVWASISQKDCPLENRIAVLETLLEYAQLWRVVVTDPMSVTSADIKTKVSYLGLVTRAFHLTCKTV